MSNRAYQNELAYLYEQGRAFGLAHPGLAGALTPQSQDPDVERLLEGFAFLTARIQQRADDCVPEMAQELAELLMPGYVRPLPAATIVQFDPDAQAMRGNHTMPQGTRILARPQNGTACEFRTEGPCNLLPLRIDGCELQSIGPRRQSLRVTFCLPSLAAAQTAFQGGSLRLYCGQAYAQASNLWLALLRHTVALRAEARSATIDLPAGAVTCPALSPEAGLLPGFNGAHQRVQDYFGFARRFLFLDVQHLEALSQLKSQTFSLVFTLENAPDLLGPLPRDALRLHCAPAVNLFAQSAKPLRQQSFAQEHLLRAEELPPEHMQVYTVSKVTGLCMASGSRRSYPPFGQFAHLAPSGEGRFYRLRHALSPVDQASDTYLTVLSARGTPLDGQNHVLSVDLLCTNRWLANQLRQGDISDLPNTGLPVTVRNITDVSAPLAPLLGQPLYWQLLGHMALAHRNVRSAAQVRERLTLYNLQKHAQLVAGQVNERRIDALERITAERCHRVVRGVPVGGTAYRAVLQERGFVSHGDAYLFGLVLDALIGDAQAVNAFSSLHLHLQPSQQSYGLPVRGIAQS